MSWLDRWTALWDGREHPRVLASVRILLGLVLLSDFAQIAWFDLVVPLFAPEEAGGWSNALGRDTVPWVLAWGPGTAEAAWVHFGLLVLFATTMTLGLFTRTSILCLLLLWAQHAQILPNADRGIDLLCRDALFVLMFSQCGAAFSLDARWTTGRFSGDPEAQIPSWPRTLLVLQLVVMYFTAGVQKVGLLWTPFGGYAALYAILQDPAVARFSFGWLAKQPWFFFTQLATAITVFWQMSYPLVLLWMHYRNTPDQPGRLRAWANRLRLHWVWVIVGAWFHLQLALTMELGIFPWAMMAIYPVYFADWEWRSVLQALRIESDEANPRPRE